MFPTVEYGKGDVTSMITLLNTVASFLLADSIDPPLQEIIHSTERPTRQGSEGSLQLTASREEGLSVSLATRNGILPTARELGGVPFPIQASGRPQACLTPHCSLVRDPEIEDYAQIPDPRKQGDNKCVLF